MDRLTVVRSLTHPYPLHGTVYATTGIPEVDTKIEAIPRHPRQWPFIGSVVDYLADRRHGGALPEMPRNVALPVRHGVQERVPAAGRALRGDARDALRPGLHRLHPAGHEAGPRGPARAERSPTRYLGIRPTDTLELAGNDRREPRIADGRFALRRSLLAQFDRRAAELEHPEKPDTLQPSPARRPSHSWPRESCTMPWTTPASRAQCVKPTA